MEIYATNFRRGINPDTVRGARACIQIIAKSLTSTLGDCGFKMSQHMDTRRYRNVYSNGDINIWCILISKATYYISDPYIMKK